MPILLFGSQHLGVYYGIGTGAAEAAGTVDEIATTLDFDPNKLRVFPLLASFDFVNWHYVGNAPPRPDPTLENNFWAPEVAYSDGKFYLSYSVGHEDKNHQLRVAQSDTPISPYEDSGEPVTDLNTCAFASDPHPFRNDDGQWYLFYARHLLYTEGGVGVGTALVVDLLQNMTKLPGLEKVFLRARFD